MDNSLALYKTKRFGSFNEGIQIFVVSPSKRGYKYYVLHAKKWCIIEESKSIPIRSSIEEWLGKQFADGYKILDFNCDISSVDYKGNLVKQVYQRTTVEYFRETIKPEYFPESGTDEHIFYQLCLTIDAWKLMINR